MVANHFLPLSNLTATSDPTVSDDVDSGYSQGSVWVNVVSGRAFMLINPTAGTWIRLGSRDHDHTAADDGGVLTDDVHDGYVDLGSVSVSGSYPGNPASGTGRIYATVSGTSINLIFRSATGVTTTLATIAQAEVATLAKNWVE